MIFGNKISKKINQDEAVALGASIYARSIMDGKNRELFEDITPLSIGILDSDGTMKPLIKRFTKIPCYGIKTFITTEDNQEEADINVYEREDFEHGENNTFIDHAIVRGLSLKPKGKCHVKIKLSINESGITEMRAKEKETDNRLQVTLSRPGLLSQKKLDELISKFQKMQDNENKFNEINLAIGIFKEYLDDLEKKINDNKNKIQNSEKILNKINSIRKCFGEIGEQNIDKGQIEKWKFQLESMRTK